MTSKQTENLKTEGKSITYSYAPQHRRLQNLVVNAKVGTIMDNAYSYDAVRNGLSVVSKAAFPVKGISTVIDGIPMAPDRPFQKQLDQQIILKS